MKLIEGDKRRGRARVHIYPLDFELLQKGTWLEGRELEEAVMPVRRTDYAKWPLALAALCARIEKDTGIICKVDHDRIRLLDDVEADEYLMRRAERAVSSLHKTAQRRTLIDRDAMTQEQRDVAERRDRVVFAVALASRQALRKQNQIESMMKKLVPPKKEVAG